MPNRSKETEKERVCIGAVAGARGVRGELRLKSFAANLADIGSYGSVETEDKKNRFTLSQVRVQGDWVFAKAETITSREEALALKGSRLYVDRDSLPPLEEEEFYHADLIGLDARMSDGEKLGQVAAMQNYGAGDLVEISLAKGAPLLLPFTREVVPQVDIQGGFIVVEPPALSEDEPDLSDDEDEREKEGEN